MAKTVRQTTLETLKAQMEPLSNYTLVNMWNALQGDQSSIHLVPLADVLKERGIKVRRGKTCKRKFVSDEALANLRKYGTVLGRSCRALNLPQASMEIDKRSPAEVAAKRALQSGILPVVPPAKAAKPVVEKITPKIAINRVMKAGNLLRVLMAQSRWTPENCDKFLVKRTPGLAKTLRAPIKKRYAAYEKFFMATARKNYGIKVYNCEAGATFKALIQSGATLVQLRAGIKRGEHFVQAVPMRWSDLTEA